MSANWPWNELDLAPNADKKEILSAYARKLKSIDRDDYQAFQRLQNARKVAFRISGGAKSGARPTMTQLGAQESKPNIPSISHHEQDHLEKMEVPRSSKQQLDVKFATQPIPQSKPEANPDSKLEPYVAEGREPTPNLLGDNQKKDEGPWTKTYTVDDFWEDYREALRAENYAEGARLLQKPIAQDRELRLAAEREAFYSINDATKGRYKITTQDLRLFEDEFSWGSDGISLKKRLNIYHMPVKLSLQMREAMGLRKLSSPRSSATTMNDFKTSSPSSQQLEVGLWTTSGREMMIIGFGYMILIFIYGVIKSALGQPPWFMNTNSAETIISEVFLVALLSYGFIGLISFLLNLFSDFLEPLNPKISAKWINRFYAYEVSQSGKPNWYRVSAFLIFGAATLLLFFINYNREVIVGLFVWLTTTLIYYCILYTLIWVISFAFPKSRRRKLGFYSKLAVFVLASVLSIYAVSRLPGDEGSGTENLSVPEEVSSLGDQSNRGT